MPSTRPCRRPIFAPTTVNARPLIALLAVASVAAFAAEQTETNSKSKMKQALTERLAQDAKAKSATPTAVKSAPAATPTAAGDSKKQTPPAAKPETPSEPPTVLPRIEVRRERITEIDQQLAKQEKEIAREQQNIKATEADKTLNNVKVAKPLAIFGGESAQFRQHVASERVELLEAERDILEAMKHVKTKDEKKELQKQLDELRAMRRELDKSLR